jgi:Thermostable hemolysin
MDLMTATSMQCTSPPAPPKPASALQVHDESDPRRREVEAFIHAVYSRRYGAQVTGFAPTLVALWEGDEITAAAGYRVAATGPLFLEHYLPLPVQRLLVAHAQALPPRERIVEVGHLAATRPGEGRRLVLMLGPHLQERGCEWVVGTLTGELRQLFVRIGVAPLTLGVADPALLGPQAGHWGRYYDHSPLVLAGHLPKAMRHIARYAAATGVRT